MSELNMAAAAIFASDVAKHEMTVLHEDGLYRHLRFTHPESGAVWFDLITWPGSLAVNAGGEGYVFSRIQDMFAFFRAKSGWNSGTINPQYWAEKLIASDVVTEYCEDLFRQMVVEYFLDTVTSGYWPRGLGKAIREQIFESPEIGWEEGAREILRDFQFKDFSFMDTWEWDLTEYSFRYLWCCHAIQWGIEQYDKARVAVTA